MPLRSVTSMLAGGTPAERMTRGDPAVLIRDLQKDYTLLIERKDTKCH
jgi:hypothetical protein